jgi:hypothetical protein
MPRLILSLSKDEGLLQAKRTPPIWPTDRHPGQAKREPEPQKDKRFNM